jgi:polysaccharide chain length determinant protein (PEP-CTERM system associated)
MGNIYDEVRAALHAVWMRRWIALAVAWAVCLGGWLVVSQMPNQYESRARVSVELRQILPTQSGSIVLDQQKDIDRIRQTLTSAVNLQKVVRGTDLARTASSDRDVADRAAGLQKAIKITAQQDNLFEISMTGPSGKLSQQIVQKLIDIFVEDNLADNRDQSSQSLRFLDQQLDVRQKALQEAEAKKADFQARYLGALPGTGSLDDRIGAARTQLAQIQSDLAAAQSSLAAVNGQMAGTAASVPGAAATATAGPARARLIAIQGQLADARSKGWTDNHPDVIALKSQLAQAQAAARNEPLIGGGAAASGNPLYLSLRSMQADKASQVAALNQRKQQIEGDLAALNAKIADAPGVAAEQGQIDREYQVLKDQYDKLLSDREQVRINSQAQTETDSVKFTVNDPPTLPRSPTAPNRPMLLTAVLIAGLGAGVAAAFALGKLRSTFDTASRLEKASGLPVIGSIGEVVTAAQVAMRRQRLTLFAGGIGALGLAYLGLVGVEFVQRGMGA